MKRSREESTEVVKRRIQPHSLGKSVDVSVLQAHHLIYQMNEFANERVKKSFEACDRFFIRLEKTDHEIPDSLFDYLKRHCLTPTAVVIVCSTIVAYIDAHVKDEFSSFSCEMVFQTKEEQKIFAFSQAFLNRIMAKNLRVLLDVANNKYKTHPEKFKTMMTSLFSPYCLFMNSERTDYVVQNEKLSHIIDEFYKFIIQMHEPVCEGCLSFQPAQGAHTCCLQYLLF